MEEIIDVVDDENRFIRKATRQEVRKNALLHKSVRVIIINKKRELLVQKRSLKKDIHPGYWDLGMAETVKSGESYEFAAIRGLIEELGIVGVSNIQLIHSFLFSLKFRSEDHNANYKVYGLPYDGTISLRDGEVEEAKFLSVPKIKELIEKEKFSDTGGNVFEKYLEERK